MPGREGATPSSLWPDAALPFQMPPDSSAMMMMMMMMMMTMMTTMMMVMMILLLTHCTSKWLRTHSLHASVLCFSLSSLFHVHLIMHISKWMPKHYVLWPLSPNLSLFYFVLVVTRSGPFSLPVTAAGGGGAGGGGGGAAGGGRWGNLFLPTGNISVAFFEHISDWLPSSSSVLKCPTIFERFKISAQQSNLQKCHHTCSWWTLKARLRSGSPLPGHAPPPIHKLQSPTSRRPLKLPTLTLPTRLSSFSSEPCCIPL